MNIEESVSGPKLNLLKPDGVRDQARADNVSVVLLDGEGWVNIIPSSFHFYKTSGDKPVPFVQFDVIGNPAGILGGHDDRTYRVEVFPTAIAGLAYELDDNE